MLIFYTTLASIISSLGLFMDNDSMVLGSMLISPMIEPIYTLASSTFSIGIIYSSVFSIIILSTLATFLQALQSDSSISKEFISVFSLCVSTYVSLMLSIFKFLKMDEKKEQVNNLSNKYADIQNKIRYILDTLKPWKDPWYLEIYQIEDKLKEWGEFKGKLANDYITLIENKQNLNTEYEKLLQHKRKKLEQRIKNDNDDSINNMILENPDSDSEEIDTGGVNILVQEI